ncbi:MAG: sensor histidine kinase, partial [Gammaproteobacteria bacterium]
LHVNFSFIDPNGNYIAQNNTIISDFTKNKTKAQEIDIVSWQDCEKTMKLGQRRIVEEEFKGRYYFSIKQPISLNGVCRGIVILSLDITEQKLMEQREQAAIIELKEQEIKEQTAKAEAEETLRRSVAIFAGNIAHDLRVPLTSILIMLDIFANSLNTVDSEYRKILRGEKADNEKLRSQLEYLNSVPFKLKNSVRELNSFIDVTLKFMQRLISGTLSNEDFSISEIEPCLNDVIAKYPFQNNERELVHYKNIDNFSFLGCPILLYKIFFNLLNNSFQQIKKNGSGEIFIRTQRNDTNNLLIFKDTAGGASPKVVQHLFDGYCSNKKEGTGVGLAFCKLTMQSFGGDIICHSVEGDYIEFILLFPRIESNS